MPPILRSLPIGLADVQGAARWFVARTTPGGTGVAQAIQTTLAETNAVVVLRNTDAAAVQGGTGSRVMLPYAIRLICTAAGASTTSAWAAIALDSIDRYGSGGTALTPGRMDTDPNGPGSIADVRAGNVTTTAPSGSRVWLHQAELKVQVAPCWAVGDEVMFRFREAWECQGAFSGSTPQRFVHPVAGGVVIWPGGSLTLHLWNVANAATAPSWDIEVTWQEF